MKRINLVSAVVFVAVISVVVAILSTAANKDKDLSGSQEKSKQAELAKATETKVTKKKTEKQSVVTASSSKPSSKSTTTKTESTQKSRPAKKVVAKSTTKKSSPEKKSKAEKSDTQVTRVRWPGMKYRTVRVTREVKIEPETELRTWTRKQWVNKVTDLRKADKDDIAEKYITAYNKQYPGKDLNNYLK